MILRPTATPPGQALRREVRSSLSALACRWGVRVRVGIGVEVVVAAAVVVVVVGVGVGVGVVGEERGGRI